MFKHYFEQVHNVEVWPIISLSIFFVFFVGLFIYVMKINRDHVKHMEQMPLNSLELDQETENTSNHG